MTTRCATCRHEVGHILKLARIIRRLRRRVLDQPRLAAVLDSCEEAGVKADERHERHLERDHGQKRAAV